MAGFGVLTMEFMEERPTLSWDMEPVGASSKAFSFSRAKYACCCVPSLDFDADNVGSTFLRNVGELLDFLTSRLVSEQPFSEHVQIYTAGLLHCGIQRAGTFCCSPAWPTLLVSEAAAVPDQQHVTCPCIYASPTSSLPSG
jgi:hypothetical protein